VIRAAVRVGTPAVARRTVEDRAIQAAVRVGTPAVARRTVEDQAVQRAAAVRVGTPAAGTASSSAHLVRLGDGDGVADRADVLGRGDALPLAFGRLTVGDGDAFRV
jgi:hypothetical protein